MPPTDKSVKFVPGHQQELICMGKANLLTQF